MHVVSKMVGLNYYAPATEFASRNCGDRSEPTAAMEGPYDDSLMRVAFTVEQLMDALFRRVVEFFGLKSARCANRRLGRM